VLEENYHESMARWHLYRRWRRPQRAQRRSEYIFHSLMHSLPKSGLFIDLGANIGDVTFAARRHGMEVIAFEPDPTAARLLATRFASDPGVTIQAKAVGASARVATLFQDPSAAKTDKATEGSSLFEREKHQGGQSYQVEVVDLVEFIRSLNRPVAVLKMDIEGAEVECLDAMLDAGVHRLIGHILVETHERISPELAAGIDRIRTRIAGEGLTNINLNWL
jgi:FkbM family methyltransferase